MSDHRLEIVDALIEFARRHDHTMLELAVSWLTSKPAIVSVIAGATSPGQVRANAADPVLQSLPAARQSTLMAERTADGYTFDIHLQGPDETVFFAV